MTDISQSFPDHYPLAVEGMTASNIYVRDVPWDEIKPYAEKLGQSSIDIALAQGNAKLDDFTENAESHAATLEEAYAKFLCDADGEPLTGFDKLGHHAKAALQEAFLVEVCRLGKFADLLETFLKSTSQPTNSN